MNLREYLQQKYGRGSAGLTLNKMEARLLNIPYPLVKGWLYRHGDCHLTYDLVKKLFLASSKYRTKHQREQAIVASEARPEPEPFQEQREWQDRHVKELGSGLRFNMPRLSPSNAHRLTDPSPYVQWDSLTPEQQAQARADGVPW